MANEKGESPQLSQWERMKGLVYVVMRRCFYLFHDRCRRMGLEMDDFMQEGFLAMMQAMEEYDESRGSFQTLLIYRCRTRALQMIGVHNEKHRKDPLVYAKPLDAPLPGTDSVTIADTLEDTEAGEAIGRAGERIDNGLLHQALGDMVGRLPAVQMQVVVCRYLEGRTVKQTADRLEITEKQAKQEEAKAFRALRYPPNQKSIKPLLDEMRYSMGISGIGLQTFKDTGESATERTAMRMTERE